MNDAAAHLQLLGGFVVSVGGVQISEAQWKSRRARSLVKLLALAPGHRLHRDQVIDSLWPESDLSAAANNFHQTLYAARKVLEPAGGFSLVLEEGFLTLSGVKGQNLSVDVEQFEEAADQAKRSQNTQAHQDAVALYTGDLLPEDLYEEWVIPRREALRQVYLNLLLDLVRLHETRQDYPAAIETLLRLLAMDKSHEEAHAGLMRLYALSGLRQSALRQYQALREALQAELEAEPGQPTTQLFEDIQAGRLSPAAPAAPAHRHNLPAELTSFIGREKQIAGVRQLVADHRLVTLTGSGGTGKTRLALKAAEGLEEDFPDGVFLVELAALSDPERVPQACVKALDVIEQSDAYFKISLNHFLEKKNLLLILDNCEHVIAACTQLVADLLKACPRLHVLATSREILSIPGEHPFRVPSLALPDLRALPPLAELAQIEAVRLFLERAAQVAPGVALTTANSAAIAQVCHRLDGIPLAIELAAARVRLLTVEQIAARLDNTFRLLTGGSRAVLPRQQTLKAMIDWSYDLLSPKERLLLQRLSVFAGGWTLEAAEVVCADETGDPLCSSEELASNEVMDLLALLVDKSLVIAEPGETETRYRLLEIIRQYARDRLLEAGCSQQVRDRHLAYFSHLSGQAEPHLRGHGMVQWLNRFDDELDNVRAALEWSLAENVTPGLQLASDLFWFWHLRSLWTEGFEWLRKLVTVEEAARGEGPLENGRALQRARGLRVLCALTSYTGSIKEAKCLALIEESISILRGLGPGVRRELGISLYHIICHQPDIALAQAQNQEMMEIFRQENERFYFSEILFEKGLLARKEQGEIDQGKKYFEESLDISREIGDVGGIGSRANNLGLHAMYTRDYARAESLFTEAIEASQKVKERWMECGVHENRVRNFLAQGRYEDAARYSQGIQERFQGLYYREGVASGMVQGMIADWAREDYARAISRGREVIETYPEIVESCRLAYFYMGRTALAQGDSMQAERLFKQATSLLVEFTTSYMRDLDVEIFLLGWPPLFSKQGKLPQAACLLGAMDAIYQSTRYILTPRERVEHDDTLAAVRAGLSAESFAAAWADSQALTLEQALEFVLAESN